MNLKKLARVASLITLLLPVMALSGCEEWKPDEVLLQDMWKEVAKITGIAPDTPPPRVVFLERTEPGYWGMLVDNTAQVYLGGIYEYIRKNRELYSKCGATCGRNLSYAEEMALPYGRAGHEMLHYALIRKGVRTVYLQHRQMKEKGYLLAIIRYIDSRLNIRQGGYSEEIAMENLEKAIRDDGE